MTVALFFLGFLVGATAATVVATCWLGRYQARHFEQLLAQIRQPIPSKDIRA